MRFLVRLRFHRKVLRLPESALEVDPVLGPGLLHVPHALCEPRDKAFAVDPERSEGPESAAGAEADLEPPTAQLVQAGDDLRQVQWTRLATVLTYTAQPSRILFGARGRVSEDCAGIQVLCSADDLLCRPGALEAELLDAAQVPAERGRVEGAVRNELGDRDCNLRRGHPWHSAATVGATRSAFAAIVSAGLRAADDGKKLLSTTKRFLTSWLRQLGSSTLAAGSVPATAVPHIWELVAMPMRSVRTMGYPALRTARLTRLISSRCGMRLFGVQLIMILSLSTITRLSGRARSSVVR